MNGKQSDQEFDQTLRVFARIFVPVLLVLVLAITGYIYVNYLLIRNRLLDSELRLIDDLAAALEKEVSQVKSTVAATALSVETRTALSSTDGSHPPLELHFLEILAATPAISFLSLIDQAGQERLRVYADERGFVTTDFGLGPVSLPGHLLESAPAHVNGEVRAVALESSDALAWMDIAVQVRDEDGNQTGILLGGYQSDLIARWLTGSAGTYEGHFWLESAAGETLFSFSAGQRSALASRPLTSPSIADVPAAARLAFKQGLNRPGSGTRNQFSFDGARFTFSRFCVIVECSPVSQGSNQANSGAETGVWTIVSYLSPARLEIVNLLKNHASEWHPIRTLLVLFVIASGVVTWIFSLTLTRLRNQEQQVEKYYSLHQAFFEKNPSILFVKDLQGRFFLANESCRHLSGNTQFNLEGRERCTVFQNEAVDAMQQQDQQVIASNEPMEFFTKWRREDGLHYYTTLRFPMYDESGNLYAVGGIANDITDQVLSRKALKESEKLFRALLESAPEAVIIAEPDGYVSLVNREAELVFDMSRDKLEGKNISELLPAIRGDRLGLLFSNEAADNMLARQQLSGVRAPDRSFPAEVSLSPVRSSSGDLLICLIRDITEQTVMDARLRQSQKLEAVGKLTGGMAHDFNNLLGIIMGNIDLAVRKAGGDPTLMKRLDTARRAAERGADLTKRMLAVARRQPLQPEPTSVNQVIEGVIALLPRTLGPDIEMQTTLGADLAPVLIDGSGLENVLINLAINARDAMLGGGVFSIASLHEVLDDSHYLVRHNLLPEGDYIRLVVSDSGTGMSKETVNHAFEPFFSTKEKHKGSGLGLSMAYGFIKQSGGHISLGSQEGIGTVVDILLPVTKAVVPVRPPPRDSVPGGDGLRFANKTVLVVDDEPGLLDVAVSYLEELGFTVLSSSRGDEALLRLSEHPEVDLLITDIVMPGQMNGVTLAEKARRSYPDLKVVYVSGFPSGVIEDKSGIKMDAPLLNKPYDRHSLASTVARVLN